MSGIYVHIPFCRTKCAYCGFFSVATPPRKELVAMICDELIRRRDYLEGEPVETIYFGGGTPTILSTEELSHIMATINSHFTIREDPEITIEANPDTVDRDYLKALRYIGFNRLSIGIQSFLDVDLRYLGRRHDAQHALQVIRDAQATGFSNFSLDLIYGVPTQTLDSWRRNLDLFFASGAPHLSAYALTIESGTILHRKIQSHSVEAPDEELTLRQYDLLCQRAENEAFLHYEISNFARKNFHSRHNSNYWNGKKYLGVGPSAHSFNGSSRQWNKATTTCCEVETIEELSTTDKLNEYLLIGLRTAHGCDINTIKTMCDEKTLSSILATAEKYQQQGLISLKDKKIILTQKGTYLTDTITANFFVTL